MPLDAGDSVQRRQRWRVRVSGAVQGVGFRPTVYRHARSCDLAGWVANTSGGVLIEAEGNTSNLRAFVRAIKTDPPPHAVIRELTTAEVAPTGETDFIVRKSERSKPGDLLILPDLATCDACLAEIFDPNNRRHLYPFTNCTHCGPRYSIITGLPYDRAATTMRDFEMCAACRAEYETPADRRFHAQPNACPGCGPQVSLWNTDSTVLADRNEAIETAVAKIAAGAVVAVKGLGGFHLVVDAANAEAVARLRARKRRPDKPLALMVPDIGAAHTLVDISSVAERALTSAAAPILLLSRRAGGHVAINVAPGNPDLGLMLPYTPLHHILLRALDRPVVATSGNLSDEPIAIDEREALQRLAGIADVFLVHNRPIVRPVEDSVLRILDGELQVLRRGRGYAPFPLSVYGQPGHPIILAVGPHLKNTAGVLKGGTQFFMSPHIGDLDTIAAEDLLARTTSDLTTYAQAKPSVVACDVHPDYASTRHAERLNLPIVRVQHHLAHVVAGAAEHDLTAPYLGVAWDGTGLGTDGTIWGGEFLLVAPDSWRRVAYLRPFPLLGGDAAAREPRRAALGLLYETIGEVAFADADLVPVQAFKPGQRRTLARAFVNGLNTPRTSSMGRLFDGVASLLDIRQTTTYEGQAAIELEWLANNRQETQAYRFENDGAVIDWRPLVKCILDDLRAGRPASDIAASFHMTLVEMIVSVAHRTAQSQIVLTGGCFQNRLLMESAIDWLRAEGLAPYWPQQVPPNDGGLALGQAVWARHELARDGRCA